MLILVGTVNSPSSLIILVVEAKAKLTKNFPSEIRGKCEAKVNF